VIQQLRATIEGLKDKCLRLSQALDKALVSQKEAQTALAQNLKENETAS